jgi:DNA repair photolyase
MSAIYEPRGKAREYSPLACNLYKGCSHGCVYCYAPSATFAKRETFYGSPSVRKGIVEIVEKEAPKIAGSKDHVLLCFTCDPYQPLEKTEMVTRKVLEIFNSNNILTQVLTKGGLLACRDFDLLSLRKENLFSVTLTHDDPAIAMEWEPGAAPPAERIESLQVAHEMGISTWVSFEPVFDPESVYRMIEKTHPFVDLYKVGKMNYHPISKTMDWVKFRETCVEMLTQLGKSYYIKSDLRLAA